MPQGPEPEEQQQQKGAQPAASSSAAPPSNQELLAQIARLYRTMGVLQQEMAAAASFASSSAAAEGDNEDELHQQPFSSLPLVEQPRITKQQHDRHELAQYMDGRNAAYDALRERATGAALSRRAGQDGPAAVVEKERQQLLLPLSPPDQHREEERAVVPASNNYYHYQQHAVAAAVKIISAGEPAGFPEKSFDVYSLGMTLEDAAGKSGRPQDDFATGEGRAQRSRSALDAADAAGPERKRKEAGSSRRFAIAVGGSDNDNDDDWRLDAYVEKDFGVQV